MWAFCRHSSFSIWHIVLTSYYLSNLLLLFCFCCCLLSQHHKILLILSHIHSYVIVSIYFFMLNSFVLLLSLLYLPVWSLSFVFFLLLYAYCHVLLLQDINWTKKEIRNIWWSIKKCWNFIFLFYKLIQEKT